MQRPRGLGIPLLLMAASIAGWCGSAQAAGTTVTANLWDKGPDSVTEGGHGIGMGEPSQATMGIRLTPSSVKAGDVTFEVVNGSKDLVHEMVIIPEPTGGKALPYDETERRIDEEAAGHLGEVSELEPGKSGAVRVNLEPGTYLLICNISGHYMSGMWTNLAVH